MSIFQNPLLSLSPLLIAVFGVNHFYRDFVKIQIGPLYILEFLFLLWFVFAWIHGTRISFYQKVSRLVWPVSLFFLWGMIRLFIELFSESEPYSLKETAQHCLLFVYPLLWVIAGFWISSQSKNLKTVLVLTLVLSILPHLTAYVPIDLGFLILNKWVNVSVGALLALFFTFWGMNLRFPPRKNAFLFFVGGFFLFLPYWKLWNGTMQRSNLLILMVMLTTAPLLYSQLKKEKLLRAIFVVIFSFVFLGAGILIQAFPKAEEKGLKTTLKTQALQTLEHGDDKPSKADPSRFKFMARRHLWNSAIEDWKKAPFFGVGLIPNFPSHVNPKIPNRVDAIPPEKQGGDLPVLPLVGPHNSYLSILGRLGGVGLVFFGVLIFFWARKAFLFLSSQKTIRPWDLFIVYIPINGFLYAFANVGLESPHNCFMLWLYVGILFGIRPKEKLMRA